VKARGFTLHEVLIVIVILAAIAAISLNACKGCTGISKDEAMKGAQVWAQNVKTQGSDVSVDCAKMDTDNDGYLSCTVFVRKDGKTDVYPIECAGAFSWNEGCRVPKAVVKGVQ
jgi:prepilin-type N-terminal cleavage/methylation domain-containing protein